ncbi:hypothetical protein JVT61DRAFT_38 [Boletus reticuloceps]|uniref:Uncharacterized protein n=1 Tax=Boletus reticuloceps TaxID=495285 RepID=A0A8I3ADH5_9AGAM|nr:hypothetical protein JVT61DRAFT_38 [Boletus reticuloceps]
MASAMDFNDMPHDAGPSHQQFMDVANERRHEWNKDNSNDVMDLLPIPAVEAKMSQITSSIDCNISSLICAISSQPLPLLPRAQCTKNNRATVHSRLKPLT